MRSLVLAIVLLVALPAAASAAPPTVAFTAPTATAVSGPTTITVEASDDVAVTRVEFRVRGILRHVDTEAPYTGVFLTGAVPDGPAPVKATAFDADGNTTDATLHLVFDNTKPGLALNGPDKQRFRPGGSQTWTFGAEDRGTGVTGIRCSVQPMDSTPVFGPCTTAGAFVLTGAGEGFWTFAVRAVDAAGNFAQQSHDIKIDGTPPETTIASGIDDGATTTDTTLSWDLEANENATFECRIVPAPFTPCSGESSHVAAGLAPGTYTFEARATDLTGNVDPTPARHTVTIVPAGAETTTTSPSSSPTETLAPEIPQIEVAVSFSFTSTRAATRLANLLVKGIPAGATVSVKCPSGCARKTYRKFKRNGGQLLLSPVLKRKLKVGTEITITVSKPGAGSAVKVLTIRSRKAPLVTTLCQLKGEKPVAC